MYEEIIGQLAKQLRQEEMTYINSHTMHLGVFAEPWLSYILDGRKTIESRFSKNKIVPYKQITNDDYVVVKKSGGDVVAYFRVKEVLFFDLNEVPIENIKNKYSKQLCVDDNFWISKSNSNYATLIVIDKVVKLKPFHITKKGMQTWIVYR